MQEGTITLSDGRKLGYAEYGNTEGLPIMWFHGMPGCRLQYFDHPDVTAMGVRVIATDRPGYGNSDPKPSRRIVDWRSDVFELADHLGIDRFRVIGGSGGGPYTLALASAPGDRVVKATVLCGAGHFNVPTWRDGMHPENIKAFESVLGGEESVRAFFTEQAEAAANLPSDSPPPIPEGIPQVDLETIAKPEMAFFAASQVEAVKNGIDGLVSDGLALAADWGFEPEDVHVPTHFWHGSVDANVPLQMAQKLAARVPNARFTLKEGDGHLSLFNSIVEIFGDLSQ